MSNALEAGLPPSSRPEQGEKSSKEGIDAAIKESGAVILEASEQHPHAEINKAWFKEMSEPTTQEIQLIADRITDYISKPIIADTFEDHALRREWRTSDMRYKPLALDEKVQITQRLSDIARAYLAYVIQSDELAKAA